jgi:hypothetical protein
MYIGMHIPGGRARLCSLKSCVAYFAGGLPAAPPVSPAKLVRLVSYVE